MARQRLIIALVISSMSTCAIGASAAPNHDSPPVRAATIGGHWIGGWSRTMNAPTGGVGVDAHVRVTYLAAGGFAEVSYGNGWLFASGVGAGLSIPQIGTDLFFVAGHHWYRELSTISEVHEESYLFSPGRQCTGVDGLSGGRNFLGGQLAVSIPTAARDSSYGLLFFYRRDLGEQTTISRDDTIHCVETSLLSSKKWDAPAHIEATFGGWVAGIGLRGAFTAGF